MKIIISPTKKQNTKEITFSSNTQAQFEKQSNFLRKHIQKIKFDEIQKRFKVSDKLAKEVYSYYHDEYPSLPAINLYNGAVFKSANISDWEQEDYDYAQNNLMILSSLYGILRPLDLVRPYRLDFFSKVDLDLYSYWNKELSSYINKIEEPILNLASKEFSKMFPEESLVNVIILEENKKTQATKAKQARGTMVHYIIKNKIKTIEEFKKFNQLSYQYNEALSDKNNLVFLKTL